MKATAEKIEAAIKLANELAQNEGLQTNGFQEYWYKFSAGMVSAELLTTKLH